MNNFTIIKKLFGFVAMLVFAIPAIAQTNPSPQILPYSQNFDALAHSATAYPAGWQGWAIAASSGVNPAGTTDFRTIPAVADRALVASSSASTTSGNVHNYNGKIGFLNSADLDLSIALALDTRGRENIEVSYDIMTIRNPGGATGRVNEVVLQYRVGTTGDFTNLTGTAYQNNLIVQNTGTDPQKLEQRTVTLPAVANDQPVVQLRWASRQVSGSGGRPSFAVDNILVTGTETGAPPVVATPAFNPNGGVFYAPVDVTITSATAGADIFFSSVGPTGPWTAYTAPINLTATDTLWAYASKTGMTNSGVASAVFTFPAITEVASIAQLRQQAVLGTTVFRITGEVLMTYGNVSRNQKYFQDPDRAAGIKIDDASGFLTTPLQPGDGVRNLLGTLSNFNNMLQFVPIQGQSPAAPSSTGNVIEPLTVVLAQLIHPANFFQVGTLEFSSFQGLLIRVPSLKFEQAGNFDRAVSFGEVPISDPTASLAAIAAGPKGVLFRVEYADLDYNTTPIPQNLVNLTAIVDQRLDVVRIFARSLADFDHNVLSNNARLQALTLGGQDALPLSSILVNDTVADPGATMFVGNFANFAGIAATPEHAGATFSVTRNGATVSPANLATLTFNAGDVVVVSVLAEDGQTRRFYKVTLMQGVRTLAFTLPAGGETYQTGQLLTVTWTSQNVSNVHLQVFEAGVANPVGELTDLPATPGEFSIPLPNGVHGLHFFRLVNAHDPTHFATSDTVNFVDILPPSIQMLFPAHNSENISLTPTFIIEIDERVWPVVMPIRNIRLHRVSDNSLIETLPVTSTRVLVAYEEIAFSFATPLSPATTYQIILDADAFVDINNNPLPGIAANAWRFTTQPLICNGDFEAWTGGRPDCWFGSKTNLAAASVVQYTAAPQSGLSAVRLIRTESGHQRFTSQLTSVVRGHTYRITFWAKGGGEVRTGLFDERADAFGYFYNPYIILNSATWQQFTQDMVADNTTAIAEFIFSVRNTIEGMGHVHIDNVTITEIPVVNVANLTGLRSRAAGETVRVTGEIVLSFQHAHRNQKFFQDAGAAIMVDDIAGMITSVYTVGDGVRNLTGTLVDNNGMLQLVPISDPGAAISTGNAIVPVDRTFATLTSADQARLVKIRNVRFDASGTFASPMNYNLTSPEGNGVFRTIFPAADYIGVAIPTQHLNLTAIVSQFQAQMQVTARNLADFEVATYLPEVPAGGVISIFPNPFSDYITITSPVKLTRVSLIDNTGRTISEFGPVTGSLTITTVDLQPGLYIIRIVAADGTQRVKKLMKR